MIRERTVGLAIRRVAIVNLTTSIERGWVDGRPAPATIPQPQPSCKCLVPTVDNSNLGGALTCLFLKTNQVLSHVNFRTRLPLKL